MALTGTDRGTGNHNTSALSFTLSPTSNFTAGALAVLCLCVDNADSGGAAHSTFTVTDTLNNTWTRRTSPLYDPGAAGTGVEGAMFTSPQNGGTIQTGTVITVTFDANTTAKVWTIMEVVGSVGTPTFKNQGVGTGSATASPTVTSASIPSGQMIIGGVFNEQGTGQTPTGDSDTTNGSWSTMQTNEIGSTAAGQTIITQRKVVTATGTQTYNPTLGTSSDVIAAWISIGEDITVNSNLGECSLIGITPTINATDNITVTTDLASLLATGVVSTVNISDNQIIVTDLASLIINGFIPDITFADPQQVDTLLGELILSSFSPTIQLPITIQSNVGELNTVGNEVVVSLNLTLNTINGELSLIGLIPIIDTSNHQLVSSNLGEIIITGFVPDLNISDHQNVLTNFGELTINGYSSSVDISVVIDTLVGNMFFEGLKPSVITPNLLTTNIGELTINGLEPLITVSLLINTVNGELKITGLIPTITATQNVLITSNTANSILTGFIPTVAGVSVRAILKIYHNGQWLTVN